MNYLTFDYGLICNRELKDSLFKMYLLIYKYSSKEGYCWVGNRRLSEDLGFSERRVKEQLKRLEELGLIECSYNGEYRKIIPLIMKDDFIAIRLCGDILLDKSLSGREMRLYILICMWSDRGYCNKNNRLLGFFMGVSDKTVKKILLSLEEKGYIIRRGTTSDRKIIPVKYILDNRAMENIKEAEDNREEYTQAVDKVEENPKNEAAYKETDLMLRKSYKKLSERKAEKKPCEDFIKAMEEKYKRRPLEKESLPKEDIFGSYDSEREFSSSG